MDGALFAPGTSSFEGASAKFRVNCGGYRLFTPGAGKGGLYTFEITPNSERKGEQRFHLQVTPASGAQTAPGLELSNYGRASGRLEGLGVQVLRLYRLDITSHSNLTLRLSAPSTAEFSLTLRDQNGGVIGMPVQRQRWPEAPAAAARGPLLRGGVGAQPHLRQLHPDARVAHDHPHQDRLRRRTREPGQTIPIKVRVSPATSGPVTVELQRFDPVFGWQFYIQIKANVSEGIAEIPFTPARGGELAGECLLCGLARGEPERVGFTYLFV